MIVPKLLKYLSHYVHGHYSMPYNGAAIPAVLKNILEFFLVENHLPYLLTIIELNIYSRAIWRCKLRASVHAAIFLSHRDDLRIFITVPIATISPSELAQN